VCMFGCGVCVYVWRYMGRQNRGLGRADCLCYGVLYLVVVCCGVVCMVWYVSRDGGGNIG